MTIDFSNTKNMKEIEDLLLKTYGPLKISFDQILTLEANGNSEADALYNKLNAQEQDLLSQYIGDRENAEKHRKDLVAKLKKELDKTQTQIRTDEKELEKLQNNDKKIVNQFANQAVKILQKEKNTPTKKNRSACSIM